MGVYTPTRRLAEGNSFSCNYLPPTPNFATFARVWENIMFLPLRKLIFDLGFPKNNVKLAQICVSPSHSKQPRHPKVPKPLVCSHFRHGFFAKVGRREKHSFSIFQLLYYVYRDLKGFGQICKWAPKTLSGNT